jgi:glycosyltransferase involved in cell wall biosynthesis
MISVSMTTYNGERFLEEQLRSLTEQTTLPNELVVCDDGSTDRTPEILAQFAKRASFPVRIVINNHRLGWRENSLKAASLCSSDYIAFCDQDDIWLKEKLAVVESYLKRNQCMLLQHGFRLIDNAGNVISPDLNWEHLELREEIWRYSYGLTQVFHRSMLEFSDLWELSQDFYLSDNQRMSHDQWIRFLSSLLGQTLSINEVLVHYRQHGNNASGDVGWGLRGDNKVNKKIVELTRSLVDSNFKKKKRQDLIAFLENAIAAASARGTIAQKIATRVGAESAGQALSKVQFYMDYTQYHAARLSAYQSAQRGQRLAATLSLLRKGQYRGRGLRGTRDAVFDVLYGIMD